MYCLDQDSNAGFMFSFSYCKKTQQCVADEWNKINAWCDEGWTSGYNLDITGDCNAYSADPLVFKSSNTDDGIAHKTSVTVLPGYF